MSLEFYQAEKIAKKHGLQVKECSAHHFQILCGVLIVNYYPTRRSVYVNGATKGKENVNFREAIDIAKGISRKVVSKTKAKRKKVTRPLRMELYKTIKSCCWCDEFMEFEETTLEHLIPLSKGGSNRRDNLSLAHGECNQEHGSKLPAKKRADHE